MERSPVAFLRPWLMLAAGLLFAVVALPAFADPPTRAARISLVSGSASFSPAGSDEWVQARLNRPIWIGDRVWSGDGRVELQLGGASLRLAPRTLLQVLNFDDRIAQFEVTQGSIALHVRSIDSDDAIEIDTPSFAFVTREEGDYRIDVERDHTAVAARRGFADIYGQDVAYRIDRRERFAFYSPDLRDYDAGALPPPDAFDKWAFERARREDRSTSARYVAPELVGFVDLDAHGDWRTDPTLGNVWVPRVAADWAPYRYGNWSWVDPWGWTWVDDAPWGFAPSHYGRWTQLGRSWAWVPGPRNVRPVYSPALVAWVGGDNFSLSVSSGRTRGVGWFPLAPGEVWRPSYEVSRDYFTRVNVANTVVNNTTVVNIYNTRNDVRISNADYRFRAAPSAVTAVPVDTFVQGRPVQLTQAQMNANAAAQANVLLAAPAQPVRQSLIGAAPRAQARPPAESMQRPVVARTAPAAAVPSLEQRAMLVREGKPVTRESLERAGPTSAPPGTPQRPVTASPAPGQATPPQGQAPAAPGQPPAAAVPAQPRANVRVVEAEKGAPKPLPEGGSRAARNDAERGRPAPGAQPGQAPVAAQPAQPPVAAQPGQPPQAAQPARPPQAAQPGQPPRTAQPPGSPEGQPGRPQVAAPQAGGSPTPETGRAPVPPVAPSATPPGRAPNGVSPRENVAPPAPSPSAPVATPPRNGAPGPAEGSNRAERPAPAQAPSPAPAVKAPASAPSPGPAAGPPGSPPAAQRPGADPPNFDQLRGRNDGPGRRGTDDQGRQGKAPDERRAQPATAPSPESTPVAPKAPVAQPPAQVRPAPAPAAPAGPTPPSAKPGEERRVAPPAAATPAAPAPAPAAPPARGEPPGRAAVPPQAAPPGARPAPEQAVPPREGGRPERGKDGRGAKDKDTPKDKDKDKDKEKDKG